ncbi:Peptidoglycan/LPS O-acetylase OafA/YrhL, contains acyltransferase and SGNH-hydrolase domains [Pseudoxanthobacter soli DSM 19599]|uniref:Peptidoglycan/LPS O-acetylase OafA/YrhL, contains acyltransferase and SGNH-hydrolase domains n=1 Tax=Pseudoxanthobacter soli DSM 19599 TaxID=1123029 RepID=A0A1M7ZDJ9_9HYPH|nr:acyltransferase [Pseudoxanthobacter soli]SHO62985.1 Peptidoglycan/LPS O-acetylase OafA/YrhL, contains acyltransferase and SGNH-hydrolase domains [Pseudoxanthobacter soli DSM 19599]
MLVSIQILRAIAALLIVVLHAYISVVNRTGVVDPAYPRIEYGGFGVDIFFVISGFIMVVSSQRMFERPGAIGDFLARRLMRIVPLYWTATLAFAAAILAFSRSTELVTWSSLAHSLLFVPQDGTLGPIITVGWTLNYEMLFYVLFACALVLPRLYAVSAVTALLVALVVLDRAVSLPPPFSTWFEPIVLEFAFGMWIALMWRHGVKLGRLPRIALVAASFVAAGLLSWQVTPTGAERVLHWGIPAAILVAAAVLGPPIEAKGSVTRLFVYLGNASYSLYITHLFAILAVRAMVMRIPGFEALVPDWLYGVLIVVGSVAGSLVVYEAFEKPVHNRLMRWWKQRPAGREAALGGVRD